MNSVRAVKVKPCQVHQDIAGRWTGNASVLTPLSVLEGLLVSPPSDHEDPAEMKAHQSMGATF
jgi:hypothetical protein